MDSSQDTLSQEEKRSVQGMLRERRLLRGYRTFQLFRNVTVTTEGRRNQVKKLYLVSSILYLLYLSSISMKKKYIYVYVRVYINALHKRIIFLYHLILLLDIICMMLHSRKIYISNMIGGQCIYCIIL